MAELKVRSLGKTSLSLTELGFGGAVLGNLFHTMTNEEAQLIINHAWEHGIRYFDTAPLYGYGLSERRLGDALRGFARHDFILSTKVGRVLVPDAEPKYDDIFKQTLPFHAQYDYSYDGIMRSFEHSLQRIGTDYIDILFIHDIGRYVHGENNSVHVNALLKNGYRALTELRDQKLIRALGMGVNEWEICLELMPSIDLDCVMLAGHYTLLKQTAQKQFLPACLKRHISVLIAGPFQSGILAGELHYNYKVADDAIMQQVKKLRDLCATHHVELPHAALQFPLLHPAVSSIVTGFRTKPQLTFAIDALQKSIPIELWDALKTMKAIEDSSCL